MDPHANAGLAWLERPGVGWAGAFIVLPAFNAVLNSLIVLTPMPLFLDSIGTALSAAVFGLPLGLATAFLTNFYQEALAGFPFRFLPFALCGMATAVLVRVMLRRGAPPTPGRFLAVTGAVALANSALGAVIATFVFGGGTGVNVDLVVAGFALALEDILSASFVARLLVNLVDKAPAMPAAMLVLARLEPRGSPAAAGVRAGTLRERSGRP